MQDNVDEAASFALFERGDKANDLRVQTDNVEQPSLAISRQGVDDRTGDPVATRLAAPDQFLQRSA